MPSPLILFAAFGASGLVTSALSRWEQSHAIRAISAADPRSLSEESSGRLKLIGAAQGRPALIAPISGKRCLAYRTWITPARWPRSKELLFAQEEQLPFSLRCDHEDGDVVVAVDPKDTPVHLLLRKERFHLRDAAADRRKQEFIYAHLYEPHMLGKLHVYEGLLEVGERVCVTGQVKVEVEQAPEIEAAQNYREQRERALRFVLENDRFQPMQLSDDPWAF